MSFSNTNDSDESDVTDDAESSSYDDSDESSGSRDSDSESDYEEIQSRVNACVSGFHISQKRKIPNISASHSNKRQKLDHGSKQKKQQKTARKYCTELLNVIKGRHRNELMEDLEDKMKKSFENDQRHDPRQAKNCCNYLLLDPRITKDHPNSDLLKKNQMRAFLNAIFYIGKGTRTRPYAHIQEAKKIMENRACKPCMTEKIQRIVDIWSAGHGVISLACFQNVTGEEALTREACMLEAIGLDNVTNAVNGTLYGGVENWPEEERRLLGAHLLHSAYYVLINEGESHIRPSDL